MLETSQKIPRREITFNIINQVLWLYCKYPCGNRGNNQETVHYQLPKDRLCNMAGKGRNMSQQIMQHFSTVNKKKLLCNLDLKQTLKQYVCSATTLKPYECPRKNIKHYIFPTGNFLIT